MSQDFGTLGRLVVSLEANLVQFEAGLNKAEYQMQQFGERMDTLTSKAGSALKGLAATAVAAFTFDAIVSGVEKAIAAAAELEQMSQKAGVSVEALSGLKSAAKLSGTALEEVVSSLQKLDKAMIEAESGSQKQASTFKALGISMSDLKTLSPDEVMLKVAKSLDQVQSGSERVTAAQILFGKAGANLLPMLHDLATQGDIVAKVTTEQAAMADQYERSLITLDSRKKALYNTIAMALLPTMVDVVDAFSKSDSVVGRLNKTAKDLAADNTIQSWARTAATGVAFVVDVFDGLTRVVQIVGKAIAATAADVTSFVGGFAGLGITFKQGGLDAVKSQISGAFSEIKSYGDEFSKDLDAILSKQFFSDKLASEFAARDAGQKTPTEKPRNVALGLGEKIGKGASAFENFLSELERQATKLESGLIPELTLKAQQLAGKEGKDAGRAAPGIAAVQAAEEKKFTDQYVDSLNKQSEAQDFSLLLVGKTAHEQELLNIQHKADVDLQVALQNETRKLGPLTEETQQKMAMATQQAADKMIAAANARYDAERKWETGAKSAMQSYIEIAGNAASQANKLYTDAFKGMEDALVNFVKTGKLDFKSLADSIISDLIRIQIQNNITKNLSAAVDAAGGFGGFFGSIASSIGSGIKNMLPSFDVGTDYVPNDMVAMVHKGEKIVPASQNAGSNGSTPVNINFTVQAIDSNSFRSTLASNQNVIVGIVRQAFTKRAITSPI